VAARLVVARQMEVVVSVYLKGQRLFFKKLEIWK
jgi:hypothetical protein